MVELKENPNTKVTQDTEAKLQTPANEPDISTAQNDFGHNGKDIPLVNAMNTKLKYGVGKHERY